MSRWEKADVRNLREIPQLPGVYALIGDGIVYYIGSAKNLRARIARHRSGRIYPLSDGTFCTTLGVVKNAYVKYGLSSSYGEELSREAKLIKRLRPKANRCHRVKTGVS